MPPLSRSGPHPGPPPGAPASHHLWNSIYSLFRLSLGSAFRKGDQEYRAGAKNNVFPSQRLTQPWPGWKGQVWRRPPPALPKTEDRAQETQPSCAGSPSPSLTSLVLSLFQDVQSLSIPCPSISPWTKVPPPGSPLTLPPFKTDAEWSFSWPYVPRSLVPEYSG